MIPLIRRMRTFRLREQPPLDRELGLYSRKHFLARLGEERDRTRRTGSPFSLLIADVERIARALAGQPKGKVLRRLHRDLVRNLLSGSRKTDIKGWFEQNEVGIILPGTAIAGALKYREKILHRIGKEWKGIQEGQLQEFIRILTFGDAETSQGGSAPDGSGKAEEPNTSKDYRLHEAIFSASNSATERAAKRMIDVVGALMGLGVASVPMLVVAALIKLTSAGPVMFRQERVGFLGRRFVLFKFRSMVANADPKIHESYVSNLINGKNENINRGTREKPFYKQTHDPRITPIGRMIRKFSLDELPQLLRGEMSLVGPRPPIPYEVEHYKLWHTGRFFEVKPGLTGLWQVTARSRASFDDMVRLDLQYANHWSLWLDLKIILKTFPALFTAHGAV
jgi:lipopolysaccharide/colanic/teichoic acid biosynthesis glycosyltransferase